MPGHDCVRDAEPVDMAAFAREHGDELVAALSKECWNGIDPHDVAQQALMLAYAKFSATDAPLPPERMFPYVFGIGRNVARTQRGVESRAHAAHREAAAAAARRPHRDLSDVATENADLARAFASLSTRHRQALLLASEGFGLDSIAEMLGLPSRHAAKMLLHRARAQIKTALGPVPCVVAPWWSWRRWITGRAADSAATVAERAAPAAGPVSSAVGAMSVVVAVSLVATFAPARTTPVVDPVAMPPGAFLRAPTVDATPTWAAAGAQTGPTPTRPSRGAATPAAPESVSSSGSGHPLTRRLPNVPQANVPSACAPTTTRRECVTKEGDTVRVGDVAVTQAVIPICHRLPATPPPASCTRQETDRWTVKDVPPLATGGTE